MTIKLTVAEKWGGGLTKFILTEFTKYKNITQVPSIASLTLLMEI